MFWKKKPATTHIPTAVELRAIIKANEERKLDTVRNTLAILFLQGNHPYTNLLSYTYDATHTEYNASDYNAELDKLKPELEALGYEVITKFQTTRRYHLGGFNQFDTLEIEYCEVRMTR